MNSPFGKENVRALRQKLALSKGSVTIAIDRQVERKQLFQLLMKVREVANGAVKAK